MLKPDLVLAFDKTKSSSLSSLKASRWTELIKEKEMEQKIIKTMEELNIFIDEFDNYLFNSNNSTVFFRNSYSHYADQEHKVEGEALAFLLEEEAEEKAHEEEF